jgi:predicted small lipoprotein YifL
MMEQHFSGGVVVRPFAPALLRLALIGALAVAPVVLAGCGRKGPLEAPPSGRFLPPTIDPATGEPRPIMSPEGYPIAPAGEQKRLPIDWLID